MKKILIILSAGLLTACAELTSIVENYPVNMPLTEAEVANGLKEALRVASDSASARLGIANGYYGDEFVKIMLPGEADVIVDNISKLPGGSKLVDDVVLRINRAAEDAAQDIGPVFWKAIKDMTITDAFNILRGDNNAATQYLKTNTYQQLYQLYQPKIKLSIDKEIVAGVSTSESWDSLSAKWNKLSKSTLGQIAGLEAVNIDLDQYLTEKALEGIFIKIAEQENNIRKDPMARVNDVLKRVFK